MRTSSGGRQNRSRVASVLLRFDDEFVAVNAHRFDVFPEGRFRLVLFQFLLEAVVEAAIERGIERGEECLRKGPPIRFSGFGGNNKLAEIVRKLKTGRAVEPAVLQFR